MLSPRALVASLFITLTALACAEDDAGNQPDPSATQATDPVVAAHVEVVRQRIFATNTKQWTVWENLHTEKATRTAPELPGPLVGRASMRAQIEELTRTFPDYHLELVEAFGSETKLVARIHTHATMTGPLRIGEQEIPATGKPFEQDWVAVLHFEGDQIASIDEFYDNYATMVQLGLAEGF